MPLYEYDCSRCGRFSDFRPIAEYALPAICPGCSADAPRISLSAPAMIVRGTQGGAMVADDASRASRFSASSGHGAACGCGCGNRVKIRREDWIRKLL